MDPLDPAQNPNFIPRKRKAKGTSDDKKPKRPYRRNPLNPSASFNVFSTPATHQISTTKISPLDSEHASFFDTHALIQDFSPPPSLLFSTPASSSSISEPPATPISPSVPRLFADMSLGCAVPDFSVGHDPVSPLITRAATPLESPFLSASSSRVLGENLEAIGGPQNDTEKARDCLGTFRKGYSPWSLFETILSSPQFIQYQQPLYRKDSTRLEDILNALWNIPQVRARMLEWFRPHMLDLLGKEVAREFEAVKRSFTMFTTDISAEWLESYDFMDEMNKARKRMPVWNAVLNSATIPSGERKREEKIAQNVITSQVLHVRSQDCSKLQHCMGLFSIGSGASQQMIETLNHCSLSTSRWTIQTDLGLLADTSVQRAALVSLGPHGYSYDNYNDCMSIHVEQRPDAPNKVQSGTLPLIYKLRGVLDPKHCLIEPIMKRLKASRPLHISDIRPRPDQSLSYSHQSRIHLIKTLCEYEGGLENIIKHSPLLQYRERYQLSPLPKTEWHALRMAFIEEASTDGNLNVHVDSYIHQMKRDPETLNDYAIVTFNDQLTNSRIRSTQVARAGDVSPWERREILQIGLAGFHLDLNLRWAICRHHMGTSRQPGSLAHFFLLMGKRRLGGEKPDYYATGQAFKQILDGLILDAWRLAVSSLGFRSIKDFIKSNPSPETLYDVAGKILKDFATPLPDMKDKPPSKPRKSQLSGIIYELFGITPDASVTPSTQSSSADVSGPDCPLPPPPPPPPSPKEEIPDPIALMFPFPSTSTTPPPPPPNPLDPDADTVRQNVRLLFRDLLFLRELKDAMSTGDVGRIEDILPDLAMIFRGCGSNKYAMEIVHYLNNLHQVWTKEFANIMRENSLVNVAGLPRHFKGIDENIEHIIGELKKQDAAKGRVDSWDRLADHAAAIKSLRSIKELFRKMFETAYQKRNHTEVDTKVLARRVADDAAHLRLQEFVPDRATEQVKATPDARKEGYEKVQRTTLPTFNKNMHAIIGNGEEGGIQEEEDEIPPVNFSLADDGDARNDSNETS
ncbi:hypothetical protein AAF712_016208 [Marasmius tenuissimus]|uniref:DUF6589 domain-containing protein n=1 Tax=Marasmius tenuissimus TaxID=585030 RepID=A0ABR2Z764_9AGAR|nr:hypothetical protein PM082_018404 [Marasmius tenuissimus]